MRRLFYTLLALVALVIGVELYVEFAGEDVDTAGISTIEDLGGEVFVSHDIYPGEVTHVRLDDTPFADRDMVYIQDWEKVQTLNFSRTRISDSTLRQLKHFPHLRVLILSGVNVTDEGIQHLRDCSRLQVLVLDHTAITDAGLRDLQSLKMLEQLTLESTKTTVEGVQQLQSALPNVAIYY